MNPYIKVLPFNALHLGHIELNETNSEIIGDPMTREQFAIANEGGPCWTLYHRTEGVIACYGFLIRWPGVASCWCLPNTKLVRKYKVTFHKACLKALASVKKAYDLHRIDTTVLDSFTISQNWMKFLGLKEEAHFEKYGPNEEPMTQYAWIRED